MEYFRYFLLMSFQPTTGHRIWVIRGPLGIGRALPERAMASFALDLGGPYSCGHQASVPAIAPSSTAEKARTES